MSTDAAPVLAVLILLAVCAVIMASAALFMAVEMHRTLRRVNGLLPQWRAAVREAHTLLARTNRATRDIEHLVHQATTTALGWLEQAAAFRHKAESFITARLGNGHHAGAEPRRTPGRRR